MRYELASPMFFGSAGFGPGLTRRPVHFADGDCRECGGECQRPDLAELRPPEPTSRRRYPRIRRARVKDAY